MRYSILGFNQAKVVEAGLDLTDLLLLNYIKEACGVPTMLHIVESEQSLVWLSHAKITEDLPILGISEGTLRNKITKLKEGGYIVSKMVTNQGCRGSRTYYGISELTTSFIYDVENPSVSLKNDTVTRPRHSKMTPYSLLDSDNKLENIPNGISETDLTENPTENISETELTEYEQHMYSEDVKKKRKNDTGEKPKRLSLFDKCLQMIEEYGTELGFDDEVKQALRDYLPVRLAIKDKPVYGANQWKGMMNKLATLKGNKVKIVQTSMERGYAGFFEPTTYSGYGRRDGNPDVSTFGESEVHKLRKVSKEERESIASGKKF